jgi:hypothetical protein
MMGLSVCRLKLLALDTCDLVDSTVLGVLLSSCAHSLRRLRLETCSLTAPLSVTRLPDLIMLDLRDCSIDLSTLCKLIGASPSLRSFSCDNLLGQDTCWTRWPRTARSCRFYTTRTATVQAWPRS